ncbi:nucleotidyl transferase AbiEii/AbiGii toxin family protein [Lacticaseibacillus paracasei]|uniref:nucleotidyl transferase AbiEii/AbiGii toxin family protein n=1 Tax=Lacticaseibacillus paracasei TaxID=1597 RepID=UPI00237F3BD5|nr:nucleotidyl transferase AbiEii/AbiGii toxin family protein [Lacticaseibacillus paracasei]MDE3284136.1 nucleotidyl transferase AbiEii/AbiGii toxin family protein [Lacticaseibacillus paracasei]
MKLGFTNGQQFKAKVRALAKEKQIDPQILMQEVVLDEIVDRISRSPYRDHLILKGGFLIASMVGVDTSIKGLPVNKDEVLKIFTEIADMNEPDGDVQLKIAKIDDIRVAADYAGFRIHIEAKIYTSIIDTKIDVSTGDTITPREISWHHHTIFNDQVITVMAYNMETILAEKLESMVARQELNSRMKDYYDLYLFNKVQRQNIDFKVLKDALLATAKLRGTEAMLPRYAEIITKLRASALLKQRWEKYRVAYVYSEGITYEATCNAALDLVNAIGLP